MHSNSPSISLRYPDPQAVPCVPSLATQAENASMGLPVVLFQDRDMTLWHQVGADKSTSQLGRTIFAVRSAEERVRIVRSALQIMGFSSLECVVFQTHDTQVISAHVLTTYSFAPFHGRYFADQCHHVDPRVEAVFGSRMPYIWDLKRLTDASGCTGMHSRLRALLTQLDRTELLSGVTLGLPIGPDLLCLLSFASPNPRKAWLSDNVVGQAISVGFTMHQLVAGYMRRVTVTSSLDGISQIRRNILEGVASGMSDKQIATWLGTSTHNVDYHLRILRQQLDVSNRTQLAYIAGRRALV